jgi:hypothetical protein
LIDWCLTPTVAIFHRGVGCFAGKDLNNLTFHSNSFGMEGFFSADNNNNNKNLD